ncbi:hypothetical protein ACFL0Y_04330 [Patescibacteria group bacterium]
MRQLALVNIGNEYLVNDSSGVRSLGTLGNLVSTLIANAYILAGIILLFLIVGGGITMIVGAGQSRPESVGKGQKTITAALIGFLIIFASYWIIQIIEVITGLDILSGGGL